MGKAQAFEISKSSNTPPRRSYPLILPRQFSQLDTKNSNIRADRGYSHSYHHTGPLQHFVPVIPSFLVRGKSKIQRSFFYFLNPAWTSDPALGSWHTVLNQHYENHSRFFLLPLLPSLFSSFQFLTFS